MQFTVMGYQVTVNRVSRHQEIELPPRHLYDVSDPTRFPPTAVLRLPKSCATRGQAILQFNQQRIPRDLSNVRFVVSGRDLSLLTEVAEDEIVRQCVIRGADEINVIAMAPNWVEDMARSAAGHYRKGQDYIRRIRAVEIPPDADLVRA